MKYFIQILFIATLALTFSACNDKNNPEDVVIPDLLKLGEFTDNGVTVVAYAVRPLTVGLNHLYFEVHEGGFRYNRPHIQFNTMMHMEDHSHASPYGTPSQDRDATHNLYESWAIFTMPSGMMGTWELQFTIQNATQSATIATGVIQISVEQANNVSTFMAEDGSRYVLTLINPRSPKVGMNDLEIAIHKRASMMEFPPVTNAIVAFHPWMPSMDHGSSNNVPPVHQSDGFYKGQVNFNMTGDWQLRFDMQIDGMTIERRTFDLEF